MYKVEKIMTKQLKQIAKNTLIAVGQLLVIIASSTVSVRP